MRVKVDFVGLDMSILKKKKKAVLEEIAQKGTNIFKKEIRKRHLINTGNLLHSVSATIKKDSVKFSIDADYAGIINDGVKKHKMRYLTNAGPIPIITKSGQKIFRVANKNNMRQGAWTHPGFKRGKAFFDVSVDKISDMSAEIASKKLI